MLGGWLSDRYTRKSSLITTTLSSSVGLFIIAISDGRAMALIGVVIAALSARSYLPAASALLVDHTAESDRVPVFALFRLLLNLGAATGSLMAIAIVPHGVHLLFFLSSCSSLLFSGVLFVGLPAVDRGGYRAGARPASRQFRPF